MAEEVPLPAILRAFCGTRNKVNWWREKGYLECDLPDGSAGVPARVSRMVGLEIGFMLSLTTIGLSPEEAQTITRPWLRQIRDGGKVHRVWVRNPNSGLMYFFGETRTLADMLAQLYDTQVDLPMAYDNRPAIVAQLINVGEIVDRLDEVFRQYGVKEAAK